MSDIFYTACRQLLSSCIISVPFPRFLSAILSSYSLSPLLSILPPPYLIEKKEDIWTCCPEFCITRRKIVKKESLSRLM